MPAIAHPFLHEIVDGSLWFDSIRKGTLTEISGSLGTGKTETVLSFLAENSTQSMASPIAWVEESFTAYPRALEQRGVSLGRFLFVESGREHLWVALQILRSGIFGVVVLTSEHSLREVELRRLQLAAEKAKSHVLLLQEQATVFGNWPISLQLRSLGHGRFEVLRGKKLFGSGV